MRVVLQRVSRANCTVNGVVAGAIEGGFVALVGAAPEDRQTEAELLAKKTAHLRVFADDDDKMNRSVMEVGGGVLVISQFTLYADMSRGRRPSFIRAAPPEIASPLVDYYADCLRKEGIARVEQGVFGAMMAIELVNDGPVTILLDSADFTK